MFEVKAMIKEEYINKYNEGCSFFFKELYVLNTDIFLIKQILDFPFEIFCAQYDCIFFNAVVNNLYEYSIIITTRLLTDTGSDVISIRKFKNDILKTYIKEEFKTDFLKLLPSENSIKDIVDKIKSLRDSRIAHSIYEYVQNPENLKQINIGELELVRDQLNAYMDAFTSPTKNVLLPVHYYTRFQNPVENRNLTDIERILDNIARQSEIITLPEHNPRLWESTKTKLGKEKLDILNHYRSKFGMTEA